MIQALVVAEEDAWQHRTVEALVEAGFDPSVCGVDDIERILLNEDVPYGLIVIALSSQEWVESAVAIAHMARLRGLSMSVVVLAPECTDAVVARLRPHRAICIPQAHHGALRTYLASHAQRSS